VLAYIRKTNDIVGELSALLEPAGSDPRRIGSLLSAAHASLRDDMGVSTAEIEKCITILNANGALGSKITGTGEGGSVFGLFEETDLQRVVTDLRDNGVWGVAVDVAEEGVRYE
jgi:galactokinase